MNIRGITNRLKRVNSWLYEAYLTYRYVDEYSVFPAFQTSSSIKLKIIKGKNAKLKIKGKILLEAWRNHKGSSVMRIDDFAEVIINNDFIIGDGIKIHVTHGGQLILNGRKNESGSGITANAVILVNKYLEIGYDCIIAWDTFLTDCDWHTVGDNYPQKNTILGEKVWLGVGVKVLKGAQIGSNTIVTSNSVVLSGIYPKQVLLSGTPAKIIKENIPDWNRDLKQ